MHLHISAFGKVSYHHVTSSSPPLLSIKIHRDVLRCKCDVESISQYLTEASSLVPFSSVHIMHKTPKTAHASTSGQEHPITSNGLFTSSYLSMVDRYNDGSHHLISYQPTYFEVDLKGGGSRFRHIRVKWMHRHDQKCGSF
jgi:hypothetical protein